MQWRTVGLHRQTIPPNPNDVYTLRKSHEPAHFFGAHFFDDLFDDLGYGSSSFGVVQPHYGTPFDVREETQSKFIPPDSTTSDPMLCVRQTSVAVTVSPKILGQLFPLPRVEPETAFTPSGASKSGLHSILAGPIQPCHVSEPLLDYSDIEHFENLLYSSSSPTPKTSTTPMTPQSTSKTDSEQDFKCMDCSIVFGKAYLLK